MFARARVHNVHTWRVEAALRGCAITSAKVAEEVIAVAQGDLTTLVLTDDNHMQSMSAFNEQQCGPGCQLCSATKRVIHALLGLFFFLTYRTVMVAWICIPTMENILNSYYMLLLQQTWWTECGPLTTSFRPSDHFVNQLINLFIHYFFKSLNQSCLSKRSNYFWY